MVSPASDCDRLLVGILACNHKDKTMACLESLARSTYTSFDVLIVDNGSGQGIAEAASVYPFVTTHTEAANIGAAAGRNIILRRFRDSRNWRALAFMDNDIVVFPDTLEQAVRFLDEGNGRMGNVGAVGAHIAYQAEPDVCWCAGGGLIDWADGSMFDGGQGGKIDGAFAYDREVDTIPTAFLCATRAAVERCGEFVDDYVIYLEDTDWCWKIKRQGFSLWASPRVRALHDVSSSLGKCTPQFYFFRTRNRLWFFLSQSRRGRCGLLFRMLRSIFIGSLYPELRNGHWRETAAILRGVLRGLRIPSALKM